jgi:hypothetical protein
MWKAVSLAKPHSGHEKSVVIVHLHKFPFVGKISWLAHQRKFFSVLGIGNAHSFFQKPLDSTFEEQAATPQLFNSCYIICTSYSKLTISRAPPNKNVWLICAIGRYGLNQLCLVWCKKWKPAIVCSTTLVPPQVVHLL